MVTIDLRMDLDTLVVGIRFQQIAYRIKRMVNECQKCLVKVAVRSSSMFGGSLLG